MTRFNIFLAFLLLPLVAVADCGKRWTVEQWSVAQIAYHAGEPYGYGYTMAALVERESFVGPYVIRHNIKDGQEGSWGIGHVQLTTAMQLENYTNLYKARAELVHRMVSDDVYAAELSARYLAHHIERRGWYNGVRRYNGGSRLYADHVTKRALQLQRCNLFNN